MRRTTIYVTHQFEGYHQWATAPDGHFLKNVHRHMFHVRLEVSVEHRDREIEFIELKQWLAKKCDDLLPHGSPKSCEQMASELVTMVLNSYGPRWVSVEVNEDGENGACVSIS